MTLSNSSSSYSIPSGGYNLRGNNSSGNNPSMGAGNYPNPIEKRPKLSHTHSERSILSKARTLIPDQNDLFFRLAALESQVEDKIVKKQNEIAASSFRSTKLRRGMKIYVSHSSFNEGVTTSLTSSNMDSYNGSANASASNVGFGSGLSADNTNNTSVTSDDATISSSTNLQQGWILRIEGKIDQTGLSHASSASGSAKKSNATTSTTPGALNMKKFSNFVKRMIVEFEPSSDGSYPGEIVEWTSNNTNQNTDNNNAVKVCDGFEIRRGLQPNSAVESISCKIHLQFDFSPERFRLAPELASLLNLTLGTRSAIVVAMWQYIKLHKLQESDEKKIINNDAALQALFRVPKMSFSDIPVLMEPYLLPPEPLIISYEIKLAKDKDFDTPMSSASGGQDVLNQVFEVEVDVEDGKSLPRTFLPPAILRDMAFHEGRIREILEALQTSQTNHKLLTAFAADPIKTTQQLLKTAAHDYETLIGDVPVTLDEVTSAQYFNTEIIEQAVSDFLSVNPRFLQF